MGDFDYINTFFNIVYRNEPAVLRDIVSRYDYVKDFGKWLEERNISMPLLTSLEEKDIKMIIPCRNFSDVDHMLHINISEEFNTIATLYQDKTHVLYIPGIHQQDIPEVPIYQYKDVYFYTLRQSFSKQDLSFFDPFSAFITAMNHADSWPGVLIFNNKESVFVSINEQKDFDEFLKHIDQGDSLFDLYADYQNDSYFIQLSDLHLGKGKGKEKGLYYLYNSLDTVFPSLKSPYPLKFLITGDLMDSPNRKNMYLANDFMNSLKKIYKADVTFILGNHDVIVHGLNIARMQKSKVIAYLLGENIKVLEKEKVILIKMDTTSQGNLARGKIGERQLQEIEDELDAIENIEDYTLFALLHHHVYPISKAQFIKTKWHEKTFINKIIETSKVLVDAPLLINWLNKKDIKYIFHGHKHLPFFRIENGRYFVGAGSATGGLKESKSRYISYNLMKYNPVEKKMKTCLIFYDDKAKAERQRVEVYIYEEENNENSR